MRTSPRRLAAALSAVVAAAALTGTGLATTTPAARAGTRSDQTSRTEARRVDRVKTPTLRWYSCQGGVECSTATLPRDYDHPDGAKVNIAVVRTPARDQAHKIGTLFVNPGGPGGSGTAFAGAAAQIFTSDILDHFDVVGFDPRGTNYSDQVKCFSSTRTQQKVLSRSNVAFPYTKTEEADYTAVARDLARACSHRGEPLSASVSTAEVARDMDVLRRAVGDQQLTYLGFSYGSYLGEVYANLFPDRVRALAIDGVINPVGWAGTRATRNQLLSDRIESADGAYKAFREILVRCGQAGPAGCSFAGGGDPVAKFDALTERLKTHPYTETDPDTGDTFTITYADLISEILEALYSPYGSASIVDLAQTLDEATAPQPNLTQQPTKTATARPMKKTTTDKVSTAWAALQKAAKAQVPSSPSHGFPYKNSAEAYSSVICSDSIDPSKTIDLSAAAAQADARAPYFGRAWFWSTAPCATKAWSARDEDRYKGPFTKVTSAPVLVVGNYWDPSTAYTDAQRTADLMPNSRLLSSDNWGHTAYGTSTCATTAIEDYLLDVDLPADGTVCHGDVQPFDNGNDQDGTRSARHVIKQIPVDAYRPLTTHIRETTTSR